MYNCEKHGNVVENKTTALVSAAIPPQFHTFQVIGARPEDSVEFTVCLLCLREWYQKNFPKVRKHAPGE